MVLIFVYGLRKRENVIEVNYDRAIEDRSENVVHELLECRRGIGELEAHHAPCYKFSNKISIRVLVYDLLVYIHGAVL